jgi:D-ornithine 4,5-aminomutase subunit beta
VTVRRQDDYGSRRGHLATLSLDELADRFWALAHEIVAPLVAMARSHTSPSIERAVLLRMGLDSLEAKAVVERCQEAGLLGHGAGHCLLRYAVARGSGLDSAVAALAAGEGWAEVRTALAGPLPPGARVAGRGPMRVAGRESMSDAGPGPMSDAGPGPMSDAGPGPARDDAPLAPGRRLDPNAILDGLESYRPRRRGWTWRQPAAAGGQDGECEAREVKVGPFGYRQIAAPLSRSVPLPAAKYFGGIDPQPDPVVTTEIASGRFEDDLRRMRMAAWHGADHIMVIRTAGQSHFDGLIEGTPEGVGGVPISRKQVRATRRALDLIEDEVGRPINFHSYVSGVAGPEIAVMFAEEGVNGAHQDPQYNVLYRNVNMLRSFVDAAEAKLLMARAGMLQIDGAHNANATAREAWQVMPELMVQHAINCAYSVAVGFEPGKVALSTVPPTAPPAPALRIDLPYAVALRRLFRGFRFRAQQNTRYIESDEREATVTHVLNLLISRLTAADIQSTITPDEGRNVPWHYNNLKALDTARQALVGLDGLLDVVELRRGGELDATAREIAERATLFLEEIAATGGYCRAVETGLFVDSGRYPERRGDGIARRMDGGVGAGTIVPREPGYLAPVCAHFGLNHLPSASASGDERPCAAIGGCTLCRHELIRWVDELDEDDNVTRRLERASPWLGDGSLLRPEVQWAGDGVVLLTLFLPAGPDVAGAAALALAERIGLQGAQVVHRSVAHPAEGTLCEVRGILSQDVRREALVLPEQAQPLGDDEIRAFVEQRRLRVVAATVGEDEHSVGMREILDIKHGGLEKWGIDCHYLGTSVPPAKLLDAAIEIDAHAVLISTIITHAEVHRLNMRRLAGLARERGVRDRLLLVGGGTQVTDAEAVECGLDAGFGRGAKGVDVASWLVRRLRADEGR